MKRKIIPKMMLACSLLLFVVSVTGVYATHSNNGEFLKQVNGSDCGPCTSLYQPNCGYPDSATTCHFEPDPGECQEGSKPCHTYCKEGPKFEYCVGVIGDCSTTMVNCTRIIDYNCNYYVAGVSCACKPGTYGNWCVRSDC